ncbi:MAG: proline--tRNA ligase [Candidatus Aenigmatarchaeota archaeon]
MAEKLKLSKKKFGEWYDRILAYSEIIDDRYPVKGLYVWKPYGYAALKLMLRKMEQLLDATGHHETYFPIFVPASLFAKEKDFLRGFGGESLRVTKVGEEKLDEELIVRPTSETIMYPMFALWIKSWRDLPLKIYQTVPIFRWETKMTKPMLRVREIVKFKEAHTVHATAEEADAQIREGIGVYEEFFRFLRVPFVVLKTPQWDTFAGALYNYDFFTVMPDGKAIELGSVINLGQKFSKAFGITYLDEKEKRQYAHQTCYGISERALGTALALHGDDKGLVFISEIAPVQVVVVPILKGKGDEKVLEYAKKIAKDLYRYRMVIDDEAGVTPGEKFFHWEAKGAPIRMEIGPKEVESGKLVVVRRDTGEKLTVAERDLEKAVEKMLKEIDDGVYERSKRFLVSMITVCKGVEEAQKALSKKGGIVRLPWCGTERCGKEMEEKLVGKALGIDEHEKIMGKCAVCGADAAHHLNFGRTY